MSSPNSPTGLPSSPLKQVEALPSSSEQKLTADYTSAVASPKGGSRRTLRPRKEAAPAESKKTRVVKVAVPVALGVAPEMILNTITGGMMVNPHHRNSVRLEHIWRPSMTLPSNNIGGELASGRTATPPPGEDDESNEEHSAGK